MTTPLRLEDIQGLDAISWWPLAPAWWCVIGATVVIATAACFMLARTRASRRSWRYKTLQELAQLERTLTPATAGAIAVQLSGLIRRLAIKRYSREACAGLQGMDWLQWLGAKDPEKFDWPQAARSLIEAPFMPQNQAIDPVGLKQSIRATKSWVT